MATKEEREREKMDALKSVINSYVRLVYRYPDGIEQELFGWIYDNLTLSGGWIDVELLVRIERRDVGIETVFNVECQTPHKA